jgi:inward rectifier potassium channel
MLKLRPSRKKRLIKRFTSLKQSHSLDLLHPATHDLYHWLLALKWRPFLLLISLFYFSINIIFALAYMTTGEGIANAQAGSFKDAFFFSIQTLSTVGYGSMYPQSIYAQILVTIEIWIGLLLLTSKH